MIRIQITLSSVVRLCLATLVVGVYALLPMAAMAAPGAISQGYQTNTTDIGQGTLLSLTATGSSTVTPANSTSNLSLLIGVAVSKPLLELSATGQSSVQVALSGTVDALVSDVNGDVKAGDKITASPISGIGMRATKAAEIVGTAQADLSSVATVSRNFTNQDGSTASAKVGLLPIALNISYYSASSSQSVVESLIPPFLQAIANSIVGKQVAPLRVLLGAIVILLGFITVTIMLYVSIKNGVVSIGRNPLASSTLRKELVDVILAATGVLAVTVALVYIILLT